MAGHNYDKKICLEKIIKKNDISFSYASNDLREGKWKGHMRIGKSTLSKLTYQRNQKYIWGGASGLLIRVGFFAGGFSG